METFGSLIIYNIHQLKVERYLFIKILMIKSVNNIQEFKDPSMLVLVEEDQYTKEQIVLQECLKRVNRPWKILVLASFIVLMAIGTLGFFLCKAVDIEVGSFRFHSLTALHNSQRLLLHLDLPDSQHLLKQQENLLHQKQFKPIQYMKEQFKPSQNCLQDQLLVEISELKEVTEKYLDIQQVEPFQELPICVLIVLDSGISVENFRSEISKDQYENSVIVYVSNKNQTQTEMFPGEIVSIVPNYSYFPYKNVISENCQQNGLIFITNQPILSGSLKSLNNLHQSYSAWITYSLPNDSTTIQIHSFYRRVFEMIQSNDFDQQKLNQMQNQNSGSFMSLAFLELSQRHKKTLPALQIFGEGQHASPLSISSISCVSKNWISYQPLFSLNQDYRINISDTQENWCIFNENKQPHYNGRISQNKYKNISYLDEIVFGDWRIDLLIKCVRPEMQQVSMKEDWVTLKKLSIFIAYVAANPKMKRLNIVRKEVQKIKKIFNIPAQDKTMKKLSEFKEILKEKGVTLVYY